MDASMTALLGFTAWTLALVFVVFGYRGLRFLQGTPINNWPRGKQDTGDAAFAKRVADAHANALENLVPFAVIVLAAGALNKSVVTNPLAMYVLYARFGQSIVHLIGTSQPLVLVRATFWSVQLLLMAWMLKGLLA